MLKALAISCIQRLKTILQSKYFYFFLSIFLVFYVLILTVFTKYSSKYVNPSFIEGVVVEVKESDNYGELILKTPEKVICKYYNQDIDILSLLGKKVKVWGSIIEVYNNTIPNTFNYQKYLYNNHIYISYKINKITILKNENIFYKIKKNFQNRNSSC